MAFSKATSASVKVRVNTTINAVIEKIDSITTIKQEQEHVLTEFLRGKDVFAVLPTEFGKSLIYQLAPLVMKMFPGTNLIFLVVSPLVALMEDQGTKEFNGRDHSHADGC